MEREPRSQAGCGGHDHPGPSSPHEGIPSGKKEMSPLPLPEPLLGSQTLHFCVLGAHSPHSSSGPVAQPCLLVLQSGPSALP